MDTRIEAGPRHHGERRDDGAWRGRARRRCGGRRGRGTARRRRVPDRAAVQLAARPLAERLVELLRRHGGVVADVSGLRLTHSGAVHAFAEAAALAGEWPDVRLALAAPDATTAALLVSSAGRPAGARAPRRPRRPSPTSTTRPELVRGWWRFTVDPQRPGRRPRARPPRLPTAGRVDEEAREAAEIVVTELVTNAVEHAASASVVEVERREHSLRLTVRDFDLAPLPEAPRCPTPTSPRGRGLAMVAAVSQRLGRRVPPRRQDRVGGDDDHGLGRSGGRRLRAARGVRAARARRAPRGRASPGRRARRPRAAASAIVRPFSKWLTRARGRRRSAGTPPGCCRAARRRTSSSAVTALLSLRSARGGHAGVVALPRERHRGLHAGVPGAQVLGGELLADQLAHGVVDVLRGDVVPRPAVAAASAAPEGQEVLAPAAPPLSELTSRGCARRAA